MQQSATQSVTHRPSFIGDSSGYLHRRGRSKYWYVRKRIPSDLVGHCFLASKSGKVRKELTRSTGKTTKREAAAVAAEVLADWDALFAVLRGEKPDAVEVSSSKVSSKPSSSDGLPDAALKLFDYLIALIVHRKKQDEGLLDQHRIDFAVRHSEQLSPEQTDKLLAPLVMGDYLGLYESKALELLGDSDKVRNFAKITGEYLKYDFGLTLAEVLDRYIERRVANGSRKSAVKNVRKIVTLFATECLSPMGLATPFKKITKQHVKKFVSESQRHWPGPKTCADNISTIFTVFRFGVRVLDAGESNPFEYAAGLLPKPKRGARKVVSNEAYDKDMLRHMLPDLARFSAKGISAAPRSLLPAVLLGMYTGMRVEEMCQLKAEDVRVAEGVRAIFLPYSKSQAGIREIPLNRGSKYVVDWLISRSQDGYLLSGLTVHDDRRSKKVSDCFNRWKTGYFSGEGHKRRYTLHSFRSTAITALDRADVQDEYISLLVGHEDGRRTLAKSVYSSGKRLQQLLEPASKIDYGDEIYELSVKLLAGHDLSN